jgi:hypothetical protein
MKLTDFSETELRTERFIMKSTGDIATMSMGRHMVIIREEGWCNYPVTISELLDTTWQVYKPELRLEKGKYYKDARGNIYECISTRHRTCDDYCIVQNAKTGGTMCLYPNGTYLRNNNSGCDLIEEVPEPKESE